ncbi:hypothetical protein [Actinoplanes sp. NPDC049316]|uniref:hypothetical protein n=1 Tax=Actinoplanes sp. NPDC049316 TaxID=3154727 RepID=UPI00344AEE2C
MTTAPARVRRTYYVLGFGNTFAASLIWGVNTIFLLDAGLTNLEAFAANAFFTAGMVLYEGGLDTVFARGQVVSRAGMLLGAGGGGYALVAAAMPVRQAYLNGMIPSRQRATILSFDSLMSSAGGVVAQPALAAPPTPGAIRCRTWPPPR